MEDKIKQHLEPILQSGNIQLFQKEAKRIIINKIIAIEAPLEEKNKIIEILELLELPIEVKYNVNTTVNKKKNVNISILGTTIFGGFLSTILRKKPFLPALLLTIGSVATGSYFIEKHQLRKAKNHRTIIKPTIETPINDILKRIEYIVKVATILAKPKKASLSNSFPDVLKWYQDAYVSSEDYGTLCSEYFKKRIEDILDIYNYKLINYDGTNDVLFQKISDSRNKTITQYLPAIIGENEYILVGSLRVPSNK